MKQLSILALSLAVSWSGVQAQESTKLQMVQGVQQVQSPVAAPSVQPTPAASPKKSQGWPRNFEKDGNSVLLCQPQIDEWKDYSTLRFRMAFAVALKGSETPVYGILAATANTTVDHSARTVILTNFNLTYRFPELAEDKASAVRAVVLDVLPAKSYVDIPLDQVLAYMQGQNKTPKVPVNLDPPKIYYSSAPTVLVNYIGAPQFKQIEGASMLFAVNTNWVVLLDPVNQKYYLLCNDFWLCANDPLSCSWSLPDILPYEFSTIPKTGQWAEVAKKIPGSVNAAIPMVLTSNVPAELILTDGAPVLSPIRGTSLMRIDNSDASLFFNMGDQSYYYLTAGRWFRAETLNGPWSAASQSLPAEFAKIPHDDKSSFVLASVPGTQEAADAVLLASVPHKATVDRTTTIQVVYDGAPNFVPVTGTTMTYAVNTPSSVILANGVYYCCDKGIWFQAPTPNGPWTVCAAVDPIIYTIPVSCPLYNVTYVNVYDATPSTVTVGYTGGYSGEFVATTGALMFGAGMLTAYLVGENNGWYHCSSWYFSYGCGCHYSYAYGGFYRPPFPWYGPGGGAGWGGYYNPATGAWGRGGYAYGPNGARWGYQAYNPFTNTYSAHGGGTNGYSSWGHGVVSHDGQWAAGAHVSTPFGGAAWAANSNGQWVEAKRDGNAYAAKASNGDIYAGRDGNLYRKDDGQWQKYNGNGNWSSPNWNPPVKDADRPSGEPRQTSFAQERESSEGLDHDSWARDRGNSNSSHVERDFSSERPHFRMGRR